MYYTERKSKHKSRGAWALLYWESEQHARRVSYLMYANGGQLPCTPSTECIHSSWLNNTSGLNFSVNFTHLLCLSIYRLHCVYSFIDYIVLTHLSITSSLPIYRLHRAYPFIDYIALTHLSITLCLPIYRLHRAYSFIDYIMLTHLSITSCLPIYRLHRAYMSRSSYFCVAV